MDTNQPKAQMASKLPNYNSRIRFRENLIIGTLASSFFLPILDIGVLGIRIDDVICLFLIPILILSGNRIAKSPYVILAILPLCSFLVSILFGYSFLEVPSSYRDFFELLRLSKPLWFVIYLLDSDEIALRTKLTRFFEIGSWIIIIITFSQYFFQGTFGTFWGSLYAEKQVRGLYSGGNRAFATGSDPNVGGVIIIFFLTFNFVKLFFSDRKVRLSILSLLLFICLLMTSSRTGLVAFVSIFIINILLSKRFSVTVKVVSLGGLCILLYSVLHYFPYLNNGFQRLLAGHNSPLEGRFGLWGEAMNLFYDSILFGWGPAKSIHPTIVDGEHFMLLRRYGMMGYLFIFLFLFGPPIFWLLLRQRTLSQLNQDIRSLIFFGINMSAVAFLIMFTNNIYSSYQLILAFVVLTGYSFVALRTNHEN